MDGQVLGFACRTLQLVEGGIAISHLPQSELLQCHSLMVWIVCTFEGLHILGGLEVADVDSPFVINACIDDAGDVLLVAPLYHFITKLTNQYQPSWP
jgi:hypothetical protein